MRTRRNEQPDPAISREFVAALPKTDLHVHLDGSLRIPTLIELARASGVELPSYTEGGLREAVYSERYKSLGDYLTGFEYTVAVTAYGPWILSEPYPYAALEAGAAHG